MTSYQKRKQEIVELEKKVIGLQKEVMAKGNVFWKEHKILGAECMVKGYVDINGIQQQVYCNYKSGKGFEIKL